MERHNKECPSDYEIGAYIDGKLTDSEMETIEKRLFSCGECWEDFVTVKKNIIQDLEEPVKAMPASLMDKAIHLYPEKNKFFNLIVSLVKDSIQIMQYTEGFQIFTPVPAGGLRRGTPEHPTMVVIKKSFDEIDVELDIEKTGRDICNIRIAVDDTMQKVSVQPLRVELVSNGRELVSNLLEEGETFLEDVGVGHYNIKIHKNGKIFGEIALKID